MCRFLLFSFRSTSLVVLARHWTIHCWLEMGLYDLLQRTRHLVSAWISSFSWKPSERSSDPRSPLKAVLSFVVRFCATLSAVNLVISQDKKNPNSAIYGQDVIQVGWCKSPLNMSSNGSQEIFSASSWTTGRSRHWSPPLVVFVQIPPKGELKSVVDKVKESFGNLFTGVKDTFGSISPIEPEDAPEADKKWSNRLSTSI